MEAFTLKKKHQLLALAMGFAFSASTLAAVTSAPTGTVKGVVPVMVSANVNLDDDADSNGVVTVGDTLAAEDGAITDADGDTPIASTYSWKVDGVEVATTATYVIAAADAGKGVTLEVIPNTDAAITDPSAGLPVIASGGTANPGGGGVIDIPDAGDVLSVAITGTVGGFPQVGTDLAAVANCVGGTCSGTLTYQWQIEDAIGSGTYVDISGATTDTYAPVRTDQRRMVRVVVDQ